MRLLVLIWFVGAAPGMSLGQDVNGDGHIVVSCLGDSNTDAHVVQGTGWCERLAASQPTWTVVNRGVFYATAVDRDPCRIAPAFCGDGDSAQMAFTLAADHPDVVIAAFGTNDVFVGPGPEATRDAYLRMGRRATEAGVEFFPALTPPRYPPQPDVSAQISLFNRTLYEAFPGHVIDFARGMRPVDFTSDGLHLNDRGQRKRFLAVRRILRRWVRVFR